MARSLIVTVIAALVLLCAPPIEARRPWYPKPPTPAKASLPAAAQKIVDGFSKQKVRVYQRAEAQLVPLRRAAVRKLKRLQDRYCKQAKLDEALAVRAKIYEVLGVRRDPGALRARPGDVGKSFLYDVRGSASGSVWGTQIYTTDSTLATAAVHAGVLKPGQRGIVRVRIFPGQPNYQGSTANGVRTMSYGAWGLSFTVEQAPQ